MKKSKPVLHDRLIINRVKQYLEENVHQTYLDVGVMARQLQDRYPEYSRRKIGPFRNLVEQAYRVVSHSYGLDSYPSSDNEGSDLEVMEETPQNTNQVNDMMTALYSKKNSGNATTTTTTTAATTSGELIDISSDDDDSEDAPKTNGKRNTDGNRKIGQVTVTPISSQPNAPATSSVASTVKTLIIKPVLPATNTAATPEEIATKKRRLTDGSSSPRYDEQPKSVNGKQSADCGPQIPKTNPMALLSQMGRMKKYKKEIVLKKANTNFNEIGGMEKVLKELCELLMHFKHPDLYHAIGLSPPRGILLHGPPGCGKTLLANAIAGQLSLAIIEIPATEFIGGISGESEERIREVFEQAAGVAPCVLFIDEIDAVSSNRINAQKDMERRIVSQLISSLDGLGQHPNGDGVLVIGATTRPEVLDPSLRRVGRFDHEISIGIPDRKGRKDILTIICDTLAVDPAIDYDKIAELTPGYVGADLLALAMRSASMAVKRECTEKIREFQENSQKNIQIVDLLDDATDQVTKDAEQTTTTDKDDSIDITMEDGSNDEKKKNSDEDTKKEEDNKKDEDNMKDEDNKKEEDNKKDDSNVKDAELKEGELKEKKDDDVTAMDTSESDSKTVTEEEKSQEKEIVENGTNEETVVVEKKTETPIEEPVKSVENLTTTTTTVNEEPIDVDEIVEKPAPKAQPLPEPSLFQLINWLDFSPIDATNHDFCITMDDFRAAVKVVQPSSKREGFITVPDVTWDDIGSLQNIREELQLAVLAPVKFPEKLEKLGLTAPSGLLLCGPPGCGKTLLAKAIANEAGINFISVKGPELMNMYVGESERAVRTIFQRARNSAPCVIFFDEFDSLCPKRSENGEAGSGTRVVNQLLTEMDGVEERKGVFLMAATNRPDIIDPAILRPGRLDTILYVGLPGLTDRVEILEALTKKGTKPTLAEDVILKNIADETDGFTGADLSGLVRQAAMLSLKESLTDADMKIEDLAVNQNHFINALRLVKPSVSKEDRKVYEKLRLKYAAPRSESNA